jgi:hypothetical protein
MMSLDLLCVVFCESLSLIDSVIEFYTFIEYIYNMIK